MEKGNFLIVYFSYTGNTKMIANMIKKNKLRYGWIKTY